MTFLRSFRVLGVAKALRALKFIELFSQPHVMVECVSNSLSAFVSMMALMPFMFYIVGLIFMGGRDRVHL